MRDINELDIVLRIGRKLRERVAHTVFGRVDKSGMVEEGADLVDSRRVRTNFGLGANDVFAILAAS